MTTQLRLFSVLLVLASFLPVSLLLAEEMVIVTGDDVNLRAKPDTRSRAMLQLNDGDKLTAISDLNDDWVEVKPPKGVTFWVYGELLHDDVIEATHVQLRAGPGINYNAVGMLNRGDKVVSRGSHVDWIEISPPQGSSVWISREYVAKPEPESKRQAMPSQEAQYTAEVSKRTPFKPQEATPVVEHTLWRIRQPPMPASDSESVLAPGDVAPAFYADADPKMVSVADVSDAADVEQFVISDDRDAEDEGGSQYKETGRPADYSGVLTRAAQVWRRPSKYRLTRADRHGRRYTICYVLGDDAKLKSYEGLSVLIHGPVHYVTGVRHPAIVAEQITRGD